MCVIFRVLIEQWIRAKYEREEFSTQMKPVYMSGYMEGYLMKRGKEDSKYQPRKFILSEAEDTLKYYVKENKEPKAVLRISELNVVFAPEKMKYVTKNQSLIWNIELIFGTIIFAKLLMNKTFYM